MFKPSLSEKELTALSSRIRYVYEHEELSSNTLAEKILKEWIFDDRSSIYFIGSDLVPQFEEFYGDISVANRKIEAFMEKTIKYLILSLKLKFI